MATIVISYRRDDTKWVTGRIFDRLEHHFGHGHVFMDIDNIPYGRDFREHLTDTLDRCDAVVAVIGPNWVGVSETHETRLHDEKDWVRLEIATALRKGVIVIPVLVDGAQMPDPSRLPEELKGLAFRQAASVDGGPGFKNGVDRISRAIEEHLRTKEALLAVETALESEGNGESTDNAPAGAVASVKTALPVRTRSLMETIGVPIFALASLGGIIALVAKTRSWPTNATAVSSAAPANPTVTFSDMRSTRPGSYPVVESSNKSNKGGDASKNANLSANSMIGSWCSFENGAGKATIDSRTNGEFAVNLYGVPDNSPVRRDGATLYFAPNSAGTFQVSYRITDENHINISSGPAPSYELRRGTYYRC